MTSTSFPFEAIGSRTTGAFLGVCNGTVWMDGDGIGVQSMTSTSFPFEAIGKRGLERGVSRTTGATGAFLGVCNGTVWIDGVDGVIDDGVGIGVVDCSGGAVSVSVSFVTEKAI